MNKSNKSNLVILYSGGADSNLLLQLAFQAEKKPYCILIDYGQKHVEELLYGQKQLEMLQIKYHTIRIEGLNIDSGLTGSLEKDRWDNVNSMNVPGRNSMLLSIALGVAENYEIDEIWYGADYSDRLNKFPDCYQEYVVKINELSKISGVKPIKIVAPLLGMPKELILDILKNQYNITQADMYSGYDQPSKENR